MADNPYIDFAFTTEDGTAERTMPERLGDVINVLEYEADPTGTLDSTTAIQAAITAAANQGTTGSSGQKGGTVFFPPGSYKVSGTIIPSVVEARVALLGAGRGATTIQGTVNDAFIFETQFTKVFSLIGEMSVINNSTTALSGACYLPHLDTSTLRNCYFKGVIGCDFSDGTFNSAAYNCEFEGTGYSDTDSMACSIGQCGLYDCYIHDSYTGVAWWNGGGIMVGCSIVDCWVGVHSGLSLVTDRDSNTAWSMHACKISNCDTGLWLTDSSTGVLSGVLIEGEFGPDGATAPQYGMYIEGATKYNTFMAVSVTAECSVSGIHNASGDQVYSFIDCVSDIGGGSGANWLMPTNDLVNFIGGNSPAYVLPYSALPAASSYEGKDFSISDGSTATWGATVTGSGANHVRVRSNGADWTVVGK